MPGDTQLTHAQGVFDLACCHWRRVPWQDVRKNRALCRSFLRAAFFHDIGKAIDRENHDIAGFIWLLPKDREAAFMVLQHMGRWGASSDKKYQLLREYNAFDLANPICIYLSEIIAACDYTHAICYKEIKKKSRNFLREKE